MDGIYAYKGKTMPEHEVRAAWKIAFAEDRLRTNRAIHLARHPESGPALSAAGTTFPELPPEALRRPRHVPKTADLPNRPVEATERGYRDPRKQSELLAFLDEIANSIVRNGASTTKTILRRMNYQPQEVRAFMRLAYKELGDASIGMDVSDHKAVSIRRHEDLYRLAIEGLDLKTALAAQRSLDRVTGVVAEELATGDAELASIADLVTRGDSSIEKILDAEVVVSGPSDEEIARSAEVGRKLPRFEDDG